MAGEAGPLIDRFAASGMHSVLVQFADLHGVAKGKLVPLERLQDLIDTGAGFSGPSIWGTGLPRMGERSEYHARIDPASLRGLPFMPGVAHAVADGYAAGLPLATCSRQLLKRQLRELERRGWRLNVGIEPEFFLLQAQGEGQGRVADAADRLLKPSYDLKAIHRNRAFIDELRQDLQALGFAIEQIDHEDANGQYELNYRHDEALAAADRYMLFKMTAHAIAERHGHQFSCMPKPLSDAAGSGLHFHLSLTDKSGLELFDGRPASNELSDLGQSFVAGLLEHADALAALCAPTVNSYKRLAAGSSRSGTTWAPVWKAHGHNNRTCLVRTVAGRLEWRLPDPSCNVYAAIAATLASGLHGIDVGLGPVAAETRDLYQAKEQGLPMPARLPGDLGQALDALERDQVLRERVGEEFCALFLDVKRSEWEEFSCQVHPWEVERYAGFY